MWTGENDLNTVTCGRGTFRNRENICPVLNLHGYVWTGPLTECRVIPSDVAFTSARDGFVLGSRRLEFHR